MHATSFSIHFEFDSYSIRNIFNRRCRWKDTLVSISCLSKREKENKMAKMVIDQALTLINSGARIFIHGKSIEQSILIELVQGYHHLLRDIE